MVSSQLGHRRNNARRPPICKKQPPPPPTPIITLDISVAITANWMSPPPLGYGAVGLSLSLVPHDPLVPNTWVGHFDAGTGHVDVAIARDPATTAVTATFSCTSPGAATFSCAKTLVPPPGQSYDWTGSPDWKAPDTSSATITLHIENA